MFLYLSLLQTNGNSATTLLKILELNINGSTFEQLENILYATHGYESFDQLD